MNFYADKDAMISYNSLWRIIKSLDVNNLNPLN
jgi:hypothetical protein